MSRLETAMTRWIVYCQIHTILPLDFRVFSPVLDRIRAHVHSQSLQEAARPDIDEFNAVADAFVSQCLTFVRKHRYYLGNNFEKYKAQLEAVLKCLHVLHCLKVGSGWTHFSSNGKKILSAHDA